MAFSALVLSTAGTLVCSPMQNSHTAPVDITSGPPWRNGAHALAHCHSRAEGQGPSVTLLSSWHRAGEQHCDSPPWCPSLWCSSTPYLVPACSPLLWEKAAQHLTDQQTGLKEGHVLREKSCVLGTVPEGNVSSLKRSGIATATKVQPTAQPGHVQGVLKTTGTHGSSKDKMKGCKGTGMTVGNVIL